MPPTYEKWLADMAPPWLQAEWGGGWLRALGRVMDEIKGEMVQARKTMMPELSAASSYADAVAVIGRDRLLERGSSETTAAYATRLRGAWDIWKRAGSHRTLLEQLVLQGCDRPNMHIVQRSGRRTSLDVAGGLVVTDGAPIMFDSKPFEAYAQFGILFTVDQPSITWDGETFSPLAATINRLAWRWRPAKAEFMGTYIIASGAVWGWPASLTWGSFDWGGTSRFIPPT